MDLRKRCTKHNKHNKHNKRNKGNKHKNQRHRSRKQRGGVVNCAEEGFNVDIQAAGEGINYKVPPMGVHEYGVHWSFDKLNEMNMGGMLDWYCRKAGLNMEECEHVMGMEEVQLLGAFFLRYKVVLEHIEALYHFLINKENDYPKSILFKRDLDGTIESVERTLRSLPKMTRKMLGDHRKINYDIVYEMIEYLPGGGRLPSFGTADIPIVATVDKVQCLLWTIIKHQKLPDGFVLDARIRQRAIEPVGIFESMKAHGYSLYLSLSMYEPKYLDVYSAIKWIEHESAMLSDPPVTLGVFV